MPKYKENYYEVSKEQAKYMSSINTKNDDHFMVELQRMPSEAVNIENRVEACEAIRTIVQRGDFLRTETDRRTTSRNRIYENLVYYQNGNQSHKSDLLELENKTLILNKFFRSTERNYAAYENLCNGCGYGVFEARGRLCNFCQYVVHGAYERRQSSSKEEEDHHSNGNIYENICDKCGTIYSSEECECCSLEDQQQQESTTEKSASLDDKPESADVLKGARVKKKRDKKSLFYGLIGSLRRAKNNLTPPQTPSQQSPRAPKRLEIVHNVDGFDNVFRTQESFDLNKICELKRTQNSCSDQHIYGRLKQRTLTAAESFTLPTTLSQSHDQLGQDRWTPIELAKQVASADCISLVEKPLNKKSNNGKRPRISKPRLLRSRSHNKEHKTVTPPAAPAKQALYLADNVCQWMTSLRHEIHNYQSFGLADDISFCDPKSIPARNTLTYGQLFTAGVKLWAPALAVTNCQNIDAREKLVSDDNNASNCEGIVTLRRSTIDLPRSPVALTRSQQMVQDFKRNLMSQYCEPTTSTPTTPPTTTTMKTSPTSAQQRAKRQAIYLKLDDNPSNSSIEIANNNNKHNNNNNNNNIHTDAKVNYTSEQQQQQQLVVEAAASQLASEHGLASRRLALQPNTAPSKRCGIYERDSEFVNDILCAFEQFLQREAADIKCDNATLSAEVPLAKREPSDDQPLLSAVEQSTACVKSRNSKSAAELSGVISVDADRVLNQKSATAVIFDDFEAEHPDHALNEHQIAVPDNCITVQPFVAAFNPSVLERNDRGALEQIFNVSELIGNLLLSRCLNNVVIYYDKSLSAFLRCLCDRAEYREKYSGWTAERLVRKYQRFASYCQTVSSQAVAQRAHSTGVGIPKKFKPVCESVKQDAELSFASPLAATESEVKCCCVDTETLNLKSLAPSVKCFECQNNSAAESTEYLRNINLECHNIKNSVSVKDLNALDECQSSEDCVVSQQTEASVGKISELETVKKPNKPRVPQRDPATCITQKSPTNSPPRPIKRSSPIVKRRINKMTVPTPNRNGTHTNNNGSNRNPNNSITEEQEEDIYQPIWKFKTVGEVQERYHTDADYYEFDDSGASAKQLSHHATMANEHPSILISNDVEDHGEWETDDEFMFTTQLEDCCTAAEAGDTQSLNSSTVRSTRSGSSITGSTVTGYASSTMTIASAVSASLMHHVFRNIGIFYSLSEPKLRAIIYDYDRVFATSYFAKRQALTAASDDFEKTSYNAGLALQERSPVPPPRTTSASKTKASDGSPKTKRNFPGGESGVASGRMPTKLQLLPDSVQAWKFMLLDVNYLEDEEDMIVSESEILRAQQPKDDIDTRQNQQLHFLQRFKSASIGNLIDIPTEEDKKSITERMRNKLQRGVFKLNVRSPKSEKKSRGLFRRAEATSLYLEDGMKPKYPIFGAPLDQLELNQTTQPNVPRFVVDCVEYIERKDCIAQDGLYRASGNKVSIDELKQKLSESYIYDPKLLVCDDIHTLTSLLKQFFRELGAPLIPQETYERLGRNLTDDAAIETMRVAFDEMREPNRSSLKFLIKHLTNVASYSSENRMPASNLAIVWGPCILSANQIEYDIARMNTLAKVLIEHHDRIFSNNENERLVC